MDDFLNVHAEQVVGTLSTFDRLVFKGHLRGLYPDGAFARFLARQRVLLKDFKPYVTGVTGALKAHAQRLAEEAGRPFEYLQAATTKKQGESKEDRARRIAERDGITEGLVCVFSVLELCKTFTVQGNRQRQRLEAVRKNTKCLHFYFYWMDPELGLIHVRLQSWFPFEIQVWMNGREWLARQLDREGIGYQRFANTFLSINDLPRAQQLCDRFARRKWPRLLDTLARKVNPMVAVLSRSGFGGYYWVVDQAEYATDVMFRDRKTLEELCAAFTEHAITQLSAHDIFRFLGRKLNGHFNGEVTTSFKHRLEGRRIKHHLKRNHIKWYDKGTVLRIETTINNPREFKVLRRHTDRKGRRSWRWLPMCKGVAHLWRYAQVARQSNGRYLEALAYVQPKGEAITELDRLCRPRVVRGTRYARFNPIGTEDTALFTAVLDGAHAIRGFRNRDLQDHLYTTPARYPADRRRRGAQTSRKIAKLRAHGLIAKVQGCRLYRPTPKGLRIMTATLHYRHSLFPDAFINAA